MTQPDRTHLRPEFRAMMEELDRQVAPPLETVTPKELRAAAEIDFPALWGPVEPVAVVEEVGFGSGVAAVRARLYRPDKAQGTLIFLHGGGWVVGSVATHDGSCRRLANAAHANVLSVEYRKAPEHPYPAPLADAWAAVEYAMANGLAGDGLAIGGESAGGTLAAVTARHARDRDVRLAGQLLIYPATDMAMTTESYRAFANGFRLTAEKMAWFADRFLPRGVDRADPDVSPLRAADLGGLAPAMVLTADHDPLRDEGRDYAARLIEAGNDVTYREVRGAVHGYWIMNAVTAVTGATIREAGAWLRARLQEAS